MIPIPCANTGLAHNLAVTRTGKLLGVIMKRAEEGDLQLNPGQLGTVVWVYKRLGHSTQVMLPTLGKGMIKKTIGGTGGKLDPFDPSDAVPGLA